MQKLLTFFITSFLVSNSFAQGYSIKGKIKGLHDTICYFGSYYGESATIRDSTHINKNGEFVFKGDKKLDGGVYLVFLPGKKRWLELLVDKDQDFSFETDTTSKMTQHVKVKGSEDNMLYYKFQNFISDEYNKAEPMQKRMAKLKKEPVSTTQKDSLKILQDKLSNINIEVEKYKTDFIKDHPASFISVIFKAQEDPAIPDTPVLSNGRKDSTFPYRYYHAHYWDNCSLSDDRLLRSPIFYNKLKYYLDKMVLQIPDSLIKEVDMLVKKTDGNKEMFKYIVWYTTKTYETDSIMGMDAVFVHLGDKYYKTWKAYWVDSTTNLKIIHRVNILEPLLIGKKAPSLILQDSLDKDVALYNVKSKYTVVAFWDPDCGHCQKVIPKLNEIYESKLKARGVTVYSVDIVGDTVKWKKFIKDHQLHWINVRDKYKQYFLHDLYDIYSTPVIYLLDENKIIRAKRIDADNINGYIDFLEKEKTAKN